MQSSKNTQRKAPDRRVAKTKKALVHALAVLLREKELSSITVTSLVELSDVNRKTFYSHYQNVLDLYEDLKHETMLKFEDTCNSLDFSVGGYGIAPTIEKLMETINSDRDYYRHLFNSPGYQNILLEAKQLLKNKFISEASTYYSINSSVLEYVADFISSGIFHTIGQWFDSDDPLPSKTLALALSDFISAGMGLLLSSYK
ncbi:TetR/AcrR family transcriptional regulator [Zhenpiania hominis]|uniref:TetR/AcrR family transcriptional regulator n=1 Tax=Zhenpiania hominis TaxID=2763644 RepID=UPI0039F4E3DA